jgi:hypothetical protein
VVEKESPERRLSLVSGSAGYEPSEPWLQGQRTAAEVGDMSCKECLGARCVKDVTSIVIPTKTRGRENGPSIHAKRYKGGMIGELSCVGRRGKGAERRYEVG